MGKGIWAGVGLLWLLIGLMFYSLHNAENMRADWTARCNQAGGVELQVGDKLICVQEQIFVEVK